MTPIVNPLSPRSAPDAYNQYGAGRERDALAAECDKFLFWRRCCRNQTPHISFRNAAAAVREERARLTAALASYAKQSQMAAPPNGDLGRSQAHCWQPILFRRRTVPPSQHRDGGTVHHRNSVVLPVAQ
jgi:hypothetical protein